MRLVRDRHLYGAPSLIAVALAVTLFLAVGPGDSAGQTTAEPKSAAVPPPPAAIPMAEVATRASEATNFLTALSAKFAPSHEIDKIQQALAEVSRQVDEEFADTSEILLQEPTLATLQAQQARWQRRRLQVTVWLTLLTKRAVDLRGTLDRLAYIKETWTRTRDAALASQSPAQILQQIESVLAAIEAEKTPLAAQQENVLDLQGAIATELARCDEVLSQVTQAQQIAVTGILTRERPPIWSADAGIRARTNLYDRLHAIASGFGSDIRQYASDPSMGMPLHAAFYLVLVLTFCAARRKRRGWVATGEGVSAMLKVFERPYAAALIVALFSASAVNSSAPAQVKELFATLALVPMIRLVRPVVDPRLISGLIATAALYALDIVRQALGGAPLIEQVLLCLESLSAMALSGWLLYSEPLRHPPASAAATGRTRALRVFVKFVMICLAVGLVAGAAGYMRLARLITPGTLSAGALALMLYALLRVASGTVAIALRVWPLLRLQMVRNHCDRIESWIHRTFVWLAVAGWAFRSLSHIGLLDQLQSLGSAILAIKLERGSISISIEDILAFVLTLWAASLLSAFIRFILREEVYTRRGVAPGLSYAYSRLINYVILAVGFLVGLGVLGMDLTKVSVLAGAFGVGIGFGLQEVVNNFVCGLILLFERPVHVGDIVEVGDLQGEVRKIGIRASTVRTYQGADIIVPNSQFITANVT
ncbi:MAG TPA: mechanosensitive ion channel domain-containing protein, partial [Desulfobacterales bacterium]|nr:mechanosensitive ion channel domain-containing protein [Desulfobacterales bacterium]